MADKVAVLGGGAMATACAILLAEHERQGVSMWLRNPQYAADLREHRENRRLLPGVHIPERIEVTGEIEHAVAGSDLLYLAIPTRYLRHALETLKNHIPEGIPVVSAAKGLEVGTFQRPSEMICSVWGERPVIALGGPSHAEEIARRMPASVVAACDDIEIARDVQKRFSTERFRVYANKDLLGVELAGALKNVMAIAAGISDGLGYGDNAKSALMTRGLVEMSRFGVELGADPSTFAGLAGIGDLITTCTSEHSRNRYVGWKLGQGETLDDILEGMTAVAEGVTTARSVFELSQDRKIDMPITREVFGVLFEGESAEEATDRLMLRPPRDE